VARASTASSTEVLAGLVDRVTYHNPDNGFCVLRVKARGQRDLITVIGHAAMISAGGFVQPSGAWINDRTHGVQFRASFLKAMARTTVEGIEKYLGSGMIRGLGSVYAKKLVRAFGEVMQVENDYDKDVYNGDLGFVSAINIEEGDFDGRKVTIALANSMSWCSPTQRRSTRARARNTRQWSSR
jgi:ATP-dependent exoDNAse (exonuclease V) alpha subunit